MAELPAYHWRTHLPGGTDPLPINLPWAYGVATTGQTVTASAELEFDAFFTNAPNTFAIDGNSGILIYEECLVVAAAFMENSSTSVNFYNQIQPAANYPTFGSEFGWGSLSGPFAWDTSLIDTTQARQNHFAIGRVFGTHADPWRAIGAIVGSCTTSSGGLVLIRIGGIGSGVNL